MKKTVVDGGPPLIYPRPMPFFSESQVTYVACGDGFTLAVVDFKNFFSWGENSHGQVRALPFFWGEIACIQKKKQKKNTWTLPPGEADVHYRTAKSWGVLKQRMGATVPPHTSIGVRLPCRQNRKALRPGFEP